MKICHFSSLHNRYDTRIFVKQCCSLAKNGDEVFLLVADGKGDEIKNDVQIVDVGPSNGMKDRIFRNNKILLQKALEIDADFYFYHDPELSIQALELVRKGKKVIYDAHEDSPRQYITNAASKGFKTKLIATTIEYLENKAAKKIFGMMTATEGIKARYDKYNKHVKVVKNYPLVEELINDVKWEDRKHQACYIGGLRDTRGIIEIIRACHISNIPLKLAGPWQPNSFKEVSEKEEGWKNVEYLGFLNRKQIADLLAESKIGFLTLYKTPNHMHALPVKLYEYMAAGVPVLSSDIPLWQEIIDESECGICVDPQNVEEITKSVNMLIENQVSAEEMGARGKKAVMEKYSWRGEMKKIKQLMGL